MSQISHEAKLLKQLQGFPGIPQYVWFGEVGESNVLIMELLGKSLEDLRIRCGNHFSLSTTLYLIDQMVTHHIIIDFSCRMFP